MQAIRETRPLCTPDLVGGTAFTAHLWNSLQLAIMLEERTAHRSSLIDKSKTGMKIGGQSQIPSPSHQSCMRLRLSCVSCSFRCERGPSGPRVKQGRLRSCLTARRSVELLCLSIWPDSSEAAVRRRSWPNDPLMLSHIDLLQNQNNKLLSARPRKSISEEGLRNSIVAVSTPTTMIKCQFEKCLTTIVTYA